MTTASASGLVGCGHWRWWARLAAKLLILRLTARGKARSRRAGSRSVRISATASLQAVAISSGGKRLVADQVAAHDPQAAGKREPVRVQALGQGGLVHQLADGVVDQQVRPDLLLDHRRGLGAQHRLRAALVGLELIQHTLNLPSRMHP